MTQVPPRALLLAGGYGTRLRPLTDTIPKCLVPIHGKPLLAYWLDLLFESGVERALINTHYLPEQVRAFKEQSHWRDRIDLVHEHDILGTAGTLRQNRAYFADYRPVFVAHADNLSVFDAPAFYEAHARRPSGCDGTVMTFSTDSPQSCGIFELADNGTVEQVHEKVENPPGNLANGAVFLLETGVLEWLTNHPEATDFCRDVVPQPDLRWFAFHNETYHRDIGTLDALRKAEEEYILD